MTTTYTAQEASKILSLSQKEGRSISVHVVYYRANKRGLGCKYSPTEMLFDDEKLIQLAKKRVDMDKEKRLKNFSVARFAKMQSTDWRTVSARPKKLTR